MRRNKIQHLYIKLCFSNQIFYLETLIYLTISTPVSVSFLCRCPCVSIYQKASSNSCSSTKNFANKSCLLCVKRGKYEFYVTLKTLGSFEGWLKELKMDILCQFSIKMDLIDDKKGCLFGCKYLLNLTYEIPWLSSHYLWCFYYTHVHYQCNADLKMTLKFFKMREDSFLI